MRGLFFKLFIWLMPLTLVGCSQPQGIHIEQVKVPVVKVEKCVKQSDIPKQPQPLHAKPAPNEIEGALSLALAKISEWVRYGHQVDPIMKGCSSNDVGVSDASK